MKTVFTLGLDESIDDCSNMDTRTLYDAIGHNSGNLAFHYAINRLIGFIPKSTHWGSSPEKIKIMGEIGIIPCANQLGSHSDMTGVAESLKEIQATFMAIGLGAQSSVSLEVIPELHPGTLDWLGQVADHALSDKPNISVRGDFTLKVMEHYGFGKYAVSLGCPSLLINKSKNLGEKLEERYRGPYTKIAVAAGHADWTPMKDLESSLVRIMEETNGAYIVQSTDAPLAMSRNDMAYVSELEKQKWRDYLKLNLSDAEFYEWVRKYMISFYNIPSWMEYLRRFDFIVGSRIHGIMLAMQAGVPGLCIAHDSRIRELCEKSMIPYVMAHDVDAGMNIEDIRSAARFNGKLFDNNRQHILDSYKDFFRNNGIQC